MQDGSALEERRGTDRDALDASRDRNVPLGAACPKLPHTIIITTRTNIRAGLEGRERREMRTREKPGDGIASVPRIKESFSA